MRYLRKQEQLVRYEKFKHFAGLVFSIPADDGDLGSTIYKLNEQVEPYPARCWIFHSHGSHRSRHILCPFAPFGTVEQDGKMKQNPTHHRVAGRGGPVIDLLLPDEDICLK